ncbi:14189_t:CDS:1, partial [Racocetra persica]
RKESRNMLATKKFDAALDLYKQEIDNNNLVNNFDILMTILLKEIKKYKTALQAHKQQPT